MNETAQGVVGSSARLGWIRKGRTGVGFVWLLTCRIIGSGSNWQGALTRVMSLFATIIAYEWLAWNLSQHLTKIIFFFFRLWRILVTGIILITCTNGNYLTVRLNFYAPYFMTFSTKFSVTRQQNLAEFAFAEAEEVREAASTQPLHNHQVAFVTEDVLQIFQTLTQCGFTAFLWSIRDLKQQLGNLFHCPKGIVLSDRFCETVKLSVQLGWALKVPMMEL
jgi:hypothetical protein